jgi:hypothetical protein
MTASMLSSLIMEPVHSPIDKTATLFAGRD